MIRRDIARAGHPPAWMLISQVEHARLSFEMAEGWSAGGVAPLDPRDEVLAAVLHHDDGWQLWERTPGVDPRLGRPLSFLEMPIDEAIVIWQRSIDVAAQIGPLAAYLVASHFSVLVARAHDAHATNPQWLALVDTFLERQTACRLDWLSEWLDGAGGTPVANRSPKLADRGLAQLQLFDALSLWLCMAQESEPATFETPGGPSLTWTPAEQGEIVVTPWPWNEAEKRLQIRGRVVPVDRYADRETLAQAASEHVDLAWRLRPAANGERAGMTATSGL